MIQYEKLMFYEVFFWGKYGDDFITSKYKHAINYLLLQNTLNENTTNLNHIMYMYMYIITNVSLNGHGNILYSHRKNLIKPTISMQ